MVTITVGSSTVQSKEEEDEQGYIYMEELENMLHTLVKYNRDDEVVKEAKGLLERIEEFMAHRRKRRE